MVIFGAGASFDSATAFRPSNPDLQAWRPPLAENLFRDSHHAFGDIVRKYPKLSHILQYLREPPPGRSVEQELESLQEEGKNNPERQRELVSIRFYLCELLTKITQEWIARTDGITNYGALIGAILKYNRSNEQIPLVTFNYDTLLDQALYTFNFKRRAPEDHLDSDPILKLFKLHGSVDWCRLVEEPAPRMPAHGVIEEANNIKLSEKFVIANASDPREMNRFPQSLFPAIAIPLQTKSDQHFECPKAHRDYLAGMLAHVTRILIVGWQAREAHFLRMLRSNLPRLERLMVVGKDQAEGRRIAEYFLAEIGFYIQPQYFGRAGFSNFIVTHEGDGFFSG